MKNETVEYFLELIEYLLAKGNICSNPVGLIMGRKVILKYSHANDATDALIKTQLVIL